MRHRRCRACIVNVLALCGSLRAASLNAALLRATARLAPDGLRVEIFSGLAELPLFNPDLEADMPAPARRLQAAITACDALLIARPEYAHGVTAVIKNALDWLVSMSAHLVTEACLALPLRSTGITEQGILDSEHAVPIRRALILLVSGAART